MKINDLSISDLKASYDFVLVHLNELQTESIKVGIEKEKIPAFNEAKVLENKLYTELLNKVLSLE